MSLRGTGRGRRWWIRLGWCTSRCLSVGLGRDEVGWRVWFRMAGLLDMELCNELAEVA